MAWQHTTQESSHVQISWCNTYLQTVLVRTYKLSVYESKKINWPIVQTFLCSHKSTDTLQALHCFDQVTLVICLPSMEPLYLKKETEKVQRLAVQMCMKQWDASYSDLLESFATPTLADRRKY